MAPFDHNPHDDQDDRTPEEIHAYEQAQEIDQLRRWLDQGREKNNVLVRMVAELQYANQQDGKRITQLNLDVSCWKAEAVNSRALLADRDAINASLRAELAQLRRERETERAEQVEALERSLRGAA